MTPPIPAAFAGPSFVEYPDAWKDLAAGAICKGQWPGWPPPESRSLLFEAIDAAGASEGTLWFADDSLQALRPCFNSGPTATAFLAQIRQPLSHGLISMVFATESPFCAENIVEHPRYDPSVATKTGVPVYSMAAVPVYFGLRCRGVLSAVTLQRPGTVSPPPPLTTRSVDLLSAASASWGEILDRQLDEAGMTQAPQK